MDTKKIKDDEYMMCTREEPQTFLCLSVDSGGTVIYEDANQKKIAVDLNEEMVFIKDSTNYIKHFPVTEQSSEEDKNWIRTALQTYNQTFGTHRGSKSLGITGE